MTRTPLSADVGDRTLSFDSEEGRTIHRLAVAVTRLLARSSGRPDHDLTALVLVLVTQAKVQNIGVDQIVRIVQSNWDAVRPSPDVPPFSTGTAPGRQPS